MKSNPNFSTTNFYKELESLLPTSTSEQRGRWVKIIVEKEVDIKYLSKLLGCEHKIATRFLWLLSEIGIYNPTKLLNALPFLLDLCEQQHPI